MTDAALVVGGLLLIVLQFAGPVVLSKFLRNRRFTSGQLLAITLAPGACLGAAEGLREHDLLANLFAGSIMALPFALIAILCLRWSRSKQNGERAFSTLLWWSLAAAWFFSVGGFILMGLLAATFGNTGSDGVLGTALKIGALGGGMCGAIMGAPVGLIRMLMLAKRSPESALSSSSPPQPSSAVDEPVSPDKARANS